jgi:plastocyanin
MSGFRAAVTALAVVGLVAVFAAGTSAAGSKHDNDDRRILVRDDCDRNDPLWNQVGGCTKKGNVTVAEFDEELDSPLADAVVGHQAWRNDPSYLVIKKGTDVRVKNVGGRPHTFTKVAEYGGGVVPPLNEGLDFSPECAGLVELPPGAKAKVSDLPVGNHRFICCFHPWMRALIKVEEKKRGHKHDD